MKKPTKPQLSLAAKAANRLFTDGAGRKAKRLVMEHGSQHTGVLGGGWCKNAVRDVIASVLAGN